MLVRDDGHAVRRGDAHGDDEPAAAARRAVLAKLRGVGQGEGGLRASLDAARGCERWVAA
eukprot:4627653-Prymnesium_polylepis.1